MDPFLIQSLIVQGKLVSPSQVDASSAYIPVGVYQSGNRKLASGNDAYPLYAIPLSDILNGGAVWGAITGTLSSQTDLQAALNSKYDISNPANYIDATALTPYLTSAGAALIYEPLLGFTPEDVANKSIDGTLSANSDTLYPSQKAVKTYADGLVSGLLDDRGNWDASTNLWPTTGGSGPGGTILKGDLWYVSVAGILGGTSVVVGNSFRALVDNPVLNSDWSILNVGLGYIPENIANKGIPNGYASLDGTGKVPASQLPSSTNLFYQTVGYRDTAMVNGSFYYFGAILQSSASTAITRPSVTIYRTGTIVKAYIYIAIPTTLNTGTFTIQYNKNNTVWAVFTTGNYSTAVNGVIKPPPLILSTPVNEGDQILFRITHSGMNVQANPGFLTIDFFIQ